MLLREVEVILGWEQASQEGLSTLHAPEAQIGHNLNLGLVEPISDQFWVVLLEPLLKSRPVHLLLSLAHRG